MRLGWALARSMSSPTDLMPLAVLTAGTKEVSAQRAMGEALAVAVDALLVEDFVRPVVRAAGHDERVTVWRGLGGVVGGQGHAGTGAVIHHHGLALFSVQGVGHLAGDGIGAPAGWKADDQGDGAGGESLAWPSKVRGVEIKEEGAAQ
jgi:hypothetical protein